MAPLPDNTSDRYFLDYTSMGIIHTLCVRFPQVTLRADADTTMFNLATALAQRMRTADSFFRARYAESGQNFSLPTSWTPINGVQPTGNIWQTDPQSACLSLVGRSFTTGRKVSVFFYSPCQTTVYPDDNRYNPGDEAVIDTMRLNAVNALNGTAGGEPAVCIDNTVPTWYSYVNIRFNAYWQNAQRG